MVLLRDNDHVVAHFHPVGDSVNLDTRLAHGLCAEHTMGSEVILDASDRTPR
jgi:hypothetical protein